MNNHHFRLRLCIPILALGVAIPAKSQIVFPTEVRLTQDSVLFIGHGESATNTINLVVRKDQTFQYRVQGTSCFLSGSSLGYWSMIADTLCLRLSGPEQKAPARFLTTSQNGDTIDIADLPQLDPAPCTGKREACVFIKYAWLEDRLMPVRCSRPEDGNWVFAEYYPVLSPFIGTSRPIFSSKTK